MWRLALLNAATGAPLTDLHEATARKVTFKLNEPTEVTFQLPGYAESAALLGELTTDVYVTWDNQPYARCRVGATTDTLDENDHRVDVAAIDYLGLLGRRYVLGGGGTETMTLTEYGWYLINRTQVDYPYPGGDFGITQGTPAATPVRTYTVADAKKMSEAIADISNLYPGFDYEIDADLVFRTWVMRGTQRDFALEYGANVSKVTRTIDPEKYANFVRQSGAEGVAAAFRYVGDLATRPEGRIEAQEGNTDLADATVVGLAADGYLARHSTILPAYQVTLSPAATWTPLALWLGDLTWLRINSGRLDTTILERVYQVAIDIGDDGNDTVTVGFGDFGENLLDLVRAVPPRLEQINRR